MDDIWQNTERKTCESTKRGTTKPTITMNHGTPHPSAKIEKLWEKIVEQTAKTVWQHNYARPGQHLIIEGWQAQCTVIN